jgi:hypothetical protein
MSCILKNIKDNTPFFMERLAPNLFSWRELENLLNLSPFINTNRLKYISDAQYEWEHIPGWSTDPSSYPTELLNKIIRKSVCYILDASRVNKKINNLCKQLEDIKSFPTDAHIYFSLSEPDTDLSGFKRHNDEQDNVIVGCEGSLKILVWEDEEPNEYILYNGDAVYIPARFDHQIIPLTARISISFAMSVGNKITYSREWINIPYR